MLVHFTQGWTLYIEVIWHSAWHMLAPLKLVDTNRTIDNSSRLDMA